MKVFFSMDIRATGSDVELRETYNILKDAESGQKNEQQTLLDPIKIQRYFDLHLMVGEKVAGQVKYTAIPF